MKNTFSRRNVLKLMGYTGLGAITLPLYHLLNNHINDNNTNDNNDKTNDDKQMLKRIIPSSKELLPVVGLGSWIQFDVGSSESDRKPLREVLTLMSEYGGKVIDSSPMYGNSEQVIGELTTELGIENNFFYATKVWTRGQQSGIDQMKASAHKMNRETLDLMQIHNLVDWQTHLKTLREWKDHGKIRYIGITHYTASAHNQLEEIVKSKHIDFVQFNYSIGVRNAESSLLHAARDNGVAVIINEPYEKGSLFKAVRGKLLPDWVAEYDIKSWGQFFLKYIISHPSVTCVIPGTSDPKHLVDNMKAGFGPMPDEKARIKMVEYFENF